MLATTASSSSAADGDRGVVDVNDVLGEPCLLDIGAAVQATEGTGEEIGGAIGGPLQRADGAGFGVVVFVEGVG